MRRCSAARSITAMVRCGFLPVPSVASVIFLYPSYKTRLLSLFVVLLFFFIFFLSFSLSSRLARDLLCLLSAVSPKPFRENTTQLDLVSIRYGKAADLTCCHQPCSHRRRRQIHPSRDLHRIKASCVRTGCQPHRRPGPSNQQLVRIR